MHPDSNNPILIDN